MPNQLEEAPIVATLRDVDDKMRRAANLQISYEWLVLQTAPLKHTQITLKGFDLERDIGPTRYWYAPTELKELFESLAQTWRVETEVLSSMHAIVLHPAYQRIIGLGRQVLPLILRELRERPYHWFWALQAITGVDPVVSSGTFSKRAKAWLDWGAENGYLN